MPSKNILLTLDDLLKTYKSREHGLRAIASYSHWFPMRSSPALAGIVADLMGDGHLQGEGKFRFDYTSKSVSELKRFDDEVYSLFSIHGKVRDCVTNPYGTSKNIGFNNRPLSRSLQLLGVPAWPKVLTRFQIPSWILEDRECFRRFVNRLFCCEATVCEESRAIEFKMYKAEFCFDSHILFFNTLRDNLLKYFGIITLNPFSGNQLRARKGGIKTKPLRMKIRNKQSLLIFYESVGFDNKAKMEKLARVLKSLT